MKTVLSSVVGASWAVALCVASAATEGEAPAEFLAAVSSEAAAAPAADYVYHEEEGPNGVYYYPEMEGLAAAGEAELEEAAAYEEQEELYEAEEEGEEGAEKRELCHGYKCKKAKGKKNKYYKNKGYKKNKYAMPYVVPARPYVVAPPSKKGAPVPQKYVAPPPAKYAAAPPPQKFAAVAAAPRYAPQKKSAPQPYVVRAPAKYSNFSASPQPAQTNNNILQRLMLQPSTIYASQGKQG